MASTIDITGNFRGYMQQHHGIDPLLFGLLYSVSFPLFMVSTAWLVRNFRAKKSVILPALLSILFWTGSYIYIATTGTNIPAWVFIVIAAAAAAFIGSAWAALSYQIPKSKRRKLPRGKGYS
jgi:hypothetical protein